MSKHKYTDIFGIAIIVAMLALTFAFINSPNWGVTAAQEEPEYADKLFSTDKVHTIDIQVKDDVWQDMIENAQAEEYIEATVVIDGEKVSGVGLRPKGNSSLAMIAMSESDRYSMKIEFDHFSNSINYNGLDKLVLNNIAQDNTYMKDYITYQMMNEMGVDAPLSSFIWVTVNGEDWGLYLAAEGVEESFAQRVYGSSSSEIYKPDMMDMNDVGNFQPGANGEGAFPGGENGGVPDRGNMPGVIGGNGEMPQRPGFGGENGEMPDPGNRPDFGQNGGQGGFGGRGGGGTSLVYTDDDPDSYSAIFENAIFNPSEADKARLIESLKQLNQNENIDQVVDVDEVIRYFAVHNFVLNSDSYTGSLIHNYYLAENDGKLSMIAWDYNLAFGGMGGLGMGRMPGGANAGQAGTNDTIDSATSMVNYPIDSPMLGGSTDEKPMIAWIFDNEAYLEKYHEVYAEYVEYFTGGRFAEMYDNAIALISPYVEKDPTAFCTYEDFQAGSSALREFSLLRAESISGQLEGTIASTSDGQTETSKAGFVDASGIDVESMGSSAMGFDRARASIFPGPENNSAETDESDATEQPTGQSPTTPTPNGGVNMTPPDGAAGFPDRGQFIPLEGMGNIPVQGNRPQIPEGTTTTTLTPSNAILLSGCVVVLIGGILFARKRRT